MAAWRKRVSYINGSISFSQPSASAAKLLAAPWHGGNRKAS
jgi:hypothetical protein